MKTPEQIAREVMGERDIYVPDEVLPIVVAAIKADRAQLAPSVRAEMDRGHAPVETVMSKEEVEERQRTSSQAGLASIRRQPIDMIFIGGQQ